MEYLDTSRPQTDSDGVDKEKFKELLTKAISMIDFEDEPEGHTETDNGFISWRFYNKGEGA